MGVQLLKGGSRVVLLLRLLLFELDIRGKGDGIVVVVVAAAVTRLVEQAVNVTATAFRLDLLGLTVLLLHLQLLFQQLLLETLLLRLHLQGEQIQLTLRMVVA